MSEYIVAVDAGHGTREYMNGSKKSPDSRFYEGEWNREVADLIIEKLEAVGIKTFKVVPEKSDISLRERCDRINKVYADNNKKVILISVHSNAAGADGKWHDAKGWSGWVSLKNASNNSKRLAKLLYEEADKAGLRGNRLVPECKYWEGNFAMVRDTHCPAVLTENMFYDNKKDVEFLLSKEGKEKIANVHVNGIRRYLELKTLY